MATDLTLPVSGVYYLPNTAIGSASYGPITGSQMIAPSGLMTQIVSGAYFFSGTFPQPFPLASATYGPVTASQMAYAPTGLPTSLVNFQVALSGSGGGGGTFIPSTFVLSGFYVVGQVRETWSGPSINTPNPSGHPLIDIIVMGSYPPQNTAT